MIIISQLMVRISHPFHHPYWVFDLAVYSACRHGHDKFMYTTALLYLQYIHSLKPPTISPSFCFDYLFLFMVSKFDFLMLFQSLRNDTLLLLFNLMNYNKQFYALQFIIKSYLKYKAWRLTSILLPKVIGFICFCHWFHWFFFS